MDNNANIQQVADDLCKLWLLPQVRHITYQQLVQYLADHIDQLLKNDFSALVQLLYRMDILEEKLRYFLANNKDQMASHTIAGLMIERQLQKIETRKKFPPNNNIPDKEKW